MYVCIFCLGCYVSVVLPQQWIYQAPRTIFLIKKFHHSSCSNQLQWGGSQQSRQVCRQDKTMQASSDAAAPDKATGSIGPRAVCLPSSPHWHYSWKVYMHLNQQVKSILKQYLPAVHWWLLSDSIQHFALITHSNEQDALFLTQATHLSNKITEVITLCN